MFHTSFTYLYCLSEDHQDRSLSVGFPGRRPGRRGWGRLGCPWWPAYRPSVQSNRQGNISPSAPRTCPESPQRPIRREISCNPAPGTLLQEDKQDERSRVTVRIGFDEVGIRLDIRGGREDYKIVVMVCQRKKKQEEVISSCGKKTEDKRKRKFSRWIFSNIQQICLGFAKEYTSKVLVMFFSANYDIYKVWCALY